MKTRFGIAAIALLGLLSCTTDHVEIAQDGLKLARIDYTNHAHTRVEVFGYNSYGQMVEIISSSKRRVVEYKGEYVHQSLSYSVVENRLSAKDSFVYDAGKNMQTIYTFGAYGGEALELSSITHFVYVNDILVQKLWTLPNSNHVSQEKYHWENDAISKVEYYDGNELYYEFFYSYDDKVNFRLGDPRFLGVPIYWSEHNVISTDYIDHYGNYDVCCKPYAPEFIYNKNGYPISISDPLGVVRELYWEE